MALTLRQKMLVHLVVQRFDRETQTTTLDPQTLSSELSASAEDVSADIDALLQQGYVERVEHVSAPGSQAAGERRPSGPWILNPTDRAVLSAMGLE